MKRASLYFLVIALLCNAAIAFTQSFPQPSIPNGTRIVCIYIVGQEQTPVALSEEWLNIWNDDYIPGLPSYTGHVSMGQYMLHGAAVTNEGYPFQSEHYNTPSRHNPCWSSIAGEAVVKADAVTDFGDFANDQGVVTGVVVCPTGCGNGVPYGTSVLTEDHHNGIQVRVDIINVQAEAPANSAAGLVIHEFGHLLGFTDIGYGVTHLGLGGYDVMGASDPGMGFWRKSRYKDLIPSPYNPYWRASYGWLNCQDVTSSAEGFHITDISAGTIYKLSSGVDPKQHFILSNHTLHQGYEQCWPGSGLMIWHINENDHSAWVLTRNHPVDLECAYGLWDWEQQGEDWIPTERNPITGRDSLDIRGIYNPIGGTIINPVGSPSDFYPGPTGNTEFTPYSNPSSNFYSMTEGFPEDIVSNICLRKIRTDEITGDIVLDIDMSRVPPSTPSKPVASNTGTLTSTNLGWAPAIDADEYQIYQGEYSNGIYTGPTMIGTSITPSYSITGLTPGKIYYYMVTAKDEDGNFSGFSEKTLVSVYQHFKGNGSRCLDHGINGEVDVWRSCNVRQNTVALSTYNQLSGVAIEQIAQGQEATLGRSGNNLMVAVTRRTAIGNMGLYGYWRPASTPGSWTTAPIYTHTGDYVYVGSPSMVIDASGNAHITWVSCVGRKPVRPNFWWNWTYTVNYCFTSPNFQNPQYVSVKSYEWGNDSFEPSDTVLYSASIANGYNGPNVIWARQGSIYHSKKSGSTFGAATTLNNCVATGVYATDPYIDAKINGTTDRICAVWAANILGGNKREIVRKEKVGGNWSAAVNVSNTPDKDSRCPQVAVNSLDEYGFIWQEEQGTSNEWDVMVDYDRHGENNVVHFHQYLYDDEIISYGPQIIDAVNAAGLSVFFTQLYADHQQSDSSLGTWLEYNLTPYYKGSANCAEAPDQNTSGAPGITLLGRNSPNPFTHSTSIRYQLAKPGTIMLQIYNITGQKVRTLVNAVQQPAYYTVNWDGRDEKGRKVSNGVYIVNLRSDNVSNTNRMTLVR